MCIHSPPTPQSRIRGNLARVPSLPDRVSSLRIDEQCFDVKAGEHPYSVAVFLDARCPMPDAREMGQNAQNWRCQGAAMTMTICRECGKEISTKVLSCPNCHAAAPSREIRFRIMIVVGILFYLLLMAWNIVTNDSSSKRSPSTSTSSVVSDARAVCSALHATDIELKCSVRSSQKTIVLVINMTASEARKMCAGVREEIRPYTRRLGDWTLRIYSPLDISSHIASCSL